MTTQSEAVLENELIEQLREKLRYPFDVAQDRSHVKISDEATLLANLDERVDERGQTPAID